MISLSASDARGRRLSWTQRCKNQGLEFVVQGSRRIGNASKSEATHALTTVARARLSCRCYALEATGALPQVWPPQAFDSIFGLGLSPLLAVCLAPCPRLLVHCPGFRGMCIRVGSEAYLSSDMTHLLYHCPCRLTGASRVAEQAECITAIQVELPAYANISCCANESETTDDCFETQDARTRSIERRLLAAWQDQIRETKWICDACGVLSATEIAAAVQSEQGIRAGS